MIYGDLDRQAAAFSGATREVPVTIASGDSQSAAADLGPSVPVGIEIPAGVEGASLTFHRAATLAGTYRAVRDETNAVVTVPFTANSYVRLPPDLLLGCRFLKVTTSEAQAGGDAALVLVVRSV